MLVPARKPRSTRRGRVAATLARAAALLACSISAPGCLDGLSQATVLAIDQSRHALRTIELASVNGTYGPACAKRSGAWSLEVKAGAALDNSALSVILDDSACDLTLTALKTTSSLVTAVSGILLTSTFGTSALGFGTPASVYVNATVSDPTFAGDIVVTIVFSDDPSLVAANNTAGLTPPVVLASTPLDAAIDRSIATRPRLTFSRPMDAATITVVTFTLMKSSTLVAGVVTLDESTNTAVFTPDAPLELEAVYTATASVGITDVRDTALAAPFVWSFTTAAVSEATVPLGTSSAFAVLAATTVTNAGASSIIGDVGVSPGTAITGMATVTLTGAVHAGDEVAAFAVADLEAAYLDAAGRTLGVIELAAATDLGGQTLAPGLYHSPTSLAVGAGNLTLDALGEADAVFVFQMGSTFVTTAGREVLLIGGADAKNIFWQVGTSATLGAASAVAGTIMADQSITVGAGATLDGRALARSAAVTLDTNVIVTP